MGNNIYLPLGVDLFPKLREDEFYYVDKTEFISELLSQKSEVNLITRPRRFGKTLMLSMLNEFLDIRRDNSSLFEGLAIEKHTELCRKWMNTRPVLFLSLKDVGGLDYEEAFGQMQTLLYELCLEHRYLADSDKVSENDKAKFSLLEKDSAGQKDIAGSLKTLTRMMADYYSRPAVLLIDEYDVPLARAHSEGYYREMLNLLRSMLSAVMKTNPNLEFAVLTGCLRIAKESIFTGMNNFVSHSISDKTYSKCFGFTEDEVKSLLVCAGLESHFDEMKQWYDGYRFGGADIYCPWDVLNHVAALQQNPDVRPKSYWKNTSHNDIIRQFIGQEHFNIKKKFETLLAGGVIKEPIVESLTYEDLLDKEENLWSMLYLTGYLTEAENISSDGNVTALRIPNEEIKTIFVESIVGWFEDCVRDSKYINRSELFEKMWGGDADYLSTEISRILFRTISYYDYREDFYHAFLTGLFVNCGYLVESNREYGLGRTDIVVKDDNHFRAVVFEVKHADSAGQMEQMCRGAVKQITSRQYDAALEEGYETVLGYGVVFCGKKCRFTLMER